jgi:hypothetical protein
MKKTVFWVAFIVFSLCSTGTPKAGMLGDVDNDGDVDITEAVHALRITSGSQSPIPVSYVMVWRGSWAENESYEMYDAVQHKGSSYICVQQHTSAEANCPPDMNMWNVLALEGEKGPEGPQGPPASAGIKVYDADGQYLGLLVAAENLHLYDASMIIYLPSIKKLIRISVTTGKTMPFDPSMGTTPFFRSYDCTGYTYFRVWNSITTKGGFDYHIIPADIHSTNSDHYTLSGQAGFYQFYSYLDDGECIYSSAFEGVGVFGFKIELPFNVPVALPLQFDTMEPSSD